MVAAGEDITSERMAGLLLLKLPQRFDPYFQSLLTSTRTTLPSWDEVVTALRQIEGVSAFRAGGVMDVYGALVVQMGNK